MEELFCCEDGLKWDVKRGGCVYGWVVKGVTNKSVLILITLNWTEGTWSGTVERWRRDLWNAKME